jgi:glycerol uptake facilitator-like aquaporin
MTTMRRLIAEGLGTALLLAVIIGSGIMGEKLAGDNAAIALLANAIATGCGLATLILMFGTISGAHFNPLVTLSEAWQKNLPVSDVLPYIVAQVIGAFVGAAAAHLMFGEPLFFASTHMRTGAAQWWSEFVATFGLLAVIISCSRSRPTVTPNDFHHLSPSISKVPVQDIARRNIEDIVVIEKEIFEHSYENGKINPKQKKYWDISVQGTVLVSLRPG